ncbi:MAG TPA: amidohydrolase, partial [Acidimicrobiales bacterium]
MRDLPKIVSADDHVVEPAHVWQDRLPAKYRDVGPRIVRAPADMSFFGGKFSYAMGGDGPEADWWLYEDLQWPHTRLGACAGFPPEEVKVAPITYDEMRPGCFRQAERLEDMETNWVEASLCFPT